MHPTINTPATSATIATTIFLQKRSCSYLADISATSSTNSMTTLPHLTHLSHNVLVKCTISIYAMTYLTHLAHLSHNISDQTLEHDIYTDPSDPNTAGQPLDRRFLGRGGRSPPVSQAHRRPIPVLGDQVANGRPAPMMTRLASKIRHSVPLDSFQNSFR